MKKHILISLLILSASSAFPNLKINELMPKNVSSLMDDDYNFSMWVEVYNSGSYSINQATYYFTDDLKIPRKWQATSHIIEAGKFSLLYFEREERYGHSNFKLDPEGGVLYITDAFSNLIDQVNYPEQYRNTSWGRLTDGGSEFGHFPSPTPGASNNNSPSSSVQCPKPIFSINGGVFNQSVQFSFVDPAPGDTIYYTLSSVEPSQTNSFRYTPGTSISVTTTRYFKAKTFSNGKIPSETSCATYIISARDYNLPVLSLVTPQSYLTDNTIGIYVRGTNGIPGNGTDAPANWNQDWDRPTNLELFDTANVCWINQEIDISIAGGWTRTMNGQKSLHLSPKKKFGNNKLKYDFFPVQKPGNKYKDIFFRDGGNDFGYTMMRDGFMNALVADRLNVDYNAYEPAICYINGQYYGIQNLRERSGKDFLYSNYKLDEDEFDIVDHIEMANGNSLFTTLTNYVKNNDITNQSIYEQFEKMIDIDNFIDYNISQIFFGNYDWPHNNLKIWRPKAAGGKWRWILYDTDFGFALYDTNLANVNSLNYAMGNTGLPEWSVIIFKRLLQNEEFKNKFIDRYSIHLGSTFKTERINQFIDSISSKIKTEIVYHKAKWGSARDFNLDLNMMKVFGATRSKNMYSYIGNQLASNSSTYRISISSNKPEARYFMNEEYIQDNQIDFYSYKNRELNFRATEIEGYNFKKWEIQSAGGSSINWIKESTEWKYWDKGDPGTEEWKLSTFDDSNWSLGLAQLGYGNKGEVTTIDYGGVSSNKFISYYFRQKFNLTNLSSKQNFALTATVDDGAVIYVNEQEIGRINMPAGTINYNTLTTTYNNGQTETLQIPVEFLKEGQNLIAVEVHQTSANSSDIIFKLKVDYDSKGEVLTEYTGSPELSLTLNSDLQLLAIYEKEDTTVSNTEMDYAGDIKIYPTLFSDEIKIEQAQGQSITVYDLSGRKVFTQEIEWMYEVINTQSWSKGIYILKIGNSSYKLIKQN